MDSEALSSFAGRLQNDVQDRVNENVSEPEAFVAEVVARLEEHQYLEAPVLTFFEKSRTAVGATRIFGFAVSDEDDESFEEGHLAGAEVSLIGALLPPASDTQSVTTSQVMDVAQRAMRAWELAVTKFQKDMDPHGDAYALFQRLHEIKPRVRTIRLIVLTDRLFTGKIDGFMLGEISVSYDIWDLERLSRLDADVEEEPIVVDFDEEFGQGSLPCLPMPAVLPEYMTWLAILSGSQVYALYKKYRLRLLERNVRSFLQARGKVNRGIRHTLQWEPGRFLAYNNGLSAIADEVETEVLSDGREAIKRVVGLQIVNGGQTTASIFYGLTEDRKNMFDLYVQLKLTKIAPAHVDEMAPKIAEYANTQNPIRQTDLTSSAPFHIALEKISRETWTPDRRSKWFYERARGSYENGLAQARASKKAQKEFNEEWPKAQRFTKAEAAAWMNLWPDDGDEPRPYEVSQGGEKNHAKWFKRYVDENDGARTPDTTLYKQLVARGIIFRAIDKAAKKTVEAHRNNVVAYSMALLFKRQAATIDLDETWTEQRGSPAVLKWIDAHVGEVDELIRSSAGARNVGEWCKKKECWDFLSKSEGTQRRMPRGKHKEL